jgi:hypothetical protein
MSDDKDKNQNQYIFTEDGKYLGNIGPSWDPFGSIHRFPTVGSTGTKWGDTLLEIFIVSSYVIVSVFLIYVAYSLFSNGSWPFGIAVAFALPSIVILLCFLWPIYEACSKWKRNRR